MAAVKLSTSSGGSASLPKHEYKAVKMQTPLPPAVSPDGSSPVGAGRDVRAISLSEAPSSSIPSFKSESTADSRTASPFEDPTEGLTDAEQEIVNDIRMLMMAQTGDEYPNADLHPHEREQLWRDYQLLIPDRDKQVEKDKAGLKRSLIPAKQLIADERLFNIAICGAPDEADVDEIYPEDDGHTHEIDPLVIARDDIRSIMQSLQITAQLAGPLMKSPHKLQIHMIWEKYQIRNKNFKKISEQDFMGILIGTRCALPSLPIQDDKPKAKQRIESFLKAGQFPKPTLPIREKFSKMEIDSLYRDYQKLCAAQGYIPLSEKDFMEVAFNKSCTIEEYFAKPADEKKSKTT